MTATPAAPHAFGCQRCVSASRAQHDAERMTGRLLQALAQGEYREARQRDEIHRLELRLTRHTPTWDVA